MDTKITDALDAFSQEALCTWLNRPGASTAVAALAISAIAVPDPVTTLAGLGLLATQMGCAFNPTDPEIKTDCQDGWRGIWYDVSNCEDQSGYNEVYIWQNVGGVESWRNWTNLAGYTFMVRWAETGVNTYECSLSRRAQGSTSPSWDSVLKASSSIPCLEIRQDREIDLTCVGKPSTGPPPPYVGPSAELNCTLKAELQNYQFLPNGNLVPVIKYTNLSATRSDPSNPEISGCNWYGDLIYTGGGGGEPPTVGPLPPAYDGPPGGPAVPDWLQDFFSGLASELIASEIAKLFEQPVPGITYLMEAPCDKDAEGNPLIWQKVIPEAPIFDALGYRITALNEQIGQHLAWKTPTCNENVEPEGNFRTISFRSVSTSPYGNSRLRKRFRYRSTSGLGLGEIIDYWKDFTFQSGSVVVGHVGSSWGSPQVWAASEDEGKRVIRHAAGEAGIDPDQVGRWAIGSSSSSRFGVSDTMKVDTTGGYYWITSRDGSDNRPVVALTSDL